MSLAAPAGTAPAWAAWLLRGALALAMPLVLSLTGCSTLRAPVPSSDLLGGRMALRIAAVGDQPARQWAAAFELKGSAERGELQLLSPLGTVVAQAQWEPGTALLRSAGQEQRFASLDELSRRALGEPLPLQALPDWLRGRAWAGAPHAAAGAGFQQEGWQVDLAGFGDGAVVIRREAAPAVTLRALMQRLP